MGLAASLLACTPVLDWRETQPPESGAVATAYGVWLVYAAGAGYLFMAAMLYAPGIVFYCMARREAHARMFQPFEAVIAALLVIAGVAAAWLIHTGAITPLS